MTKYRESYVRTHCIDLFFKFQGKPIHVMTDGNTIPDQLNDIDRNRKIQSVVAGLTNGLIVDSEHINLNQNIFRHIEGIDTDIISDDDRFQLLRLFLPMAELGFYSYDCVEKDLNGTSRYVLVGWPKQNREVYVEVPDFDGVMNSVVLDDVLMEFRM